MNYLAHAFLSFGNPQVLAGNMISDFVKGKQKLAYTEGIQKGIMLHRMIDTFTDAHAVTHEAKQCFKPAVGLYAGAFIDVVYDHFLALDETLHTPEQLNQFAQHTYITLNGFKDIMPEKFARMFPYMKRQNWLYNYRTINGIENSFYGVVKRAAYLNSSEEVFKAFINNYAALQKYYEAFFPDVKAYTFQQLQLLTTITES